MINKIFIVSFILFLNAHALWNEKEMNYYKNKYLEESKNENLQKSKKISLVSDDTKDFFARKYGQNALKRLNYVNQTIQSLENAPLHKKLVTINKLVNKFNFMTDENLWGKKNYWATPLEVIGTNHGDTEDIALLKFVLMVKVGINPKDLQLIHKDTLFIGKKESHKENVGLFFFSKKQINPFVIDYEFRKGKIYKYDDQFKFEYIRTSQSKTWDVIFKKEFSINDLDGITNFIPQKSIFENSKEVDIHY